MARNPRKSSRGTSSSKTFSAIALPTTRHRVPSNWRVVTARLLAASEADEDAGTPRREVPEIRLSGLWLERVGFPKGTRYLLSADRSFATIYLQADIPKRARRSRR